MTNMTNCKTQYVLIKLKQQPYKNRIECHMKVNQNVIDMENIVYHKVNYYITNMEFDNAKTYLSNHKDGMHEQLLWKIEKSEKFNNMYGICYTKNNEKLINDLENMYMTHILTTTPCRHDKTGNTMRIECWKCN